MIYMLHTYSTPNTPPIRHVPQVVVRRGPSIKDQPLGVMIKAGGLWNPTVANYPRVVNG